MNDRSLHDDSHTEQNSNEEIARYYAVPITKYKTPEPFYNPEPEQPTPAAEVMIELLKRVSALEKDVELLKSYRVF